MLARPDPLVRKVIGCAIEVHKALGPGLLESAYRACLARELEHQQIDFRREVQIPVIYRDLVLPCTYRADIVIPKVLLIEVKSTETMSPIFTAQVVTYIRLLDLPQGIIFNFNVAVLTKGGIRSVLRK